MNFASIFSRLIIPGVLVAGRFIVRLPLSTDPPDLGDSKSDATARWLQVEAKLKRDPDVSRLYHDFMLEYLNLGHMELVKGEDLHHQRIYYMPHHGVLKQQGETKKLRVVFNASQKTSNDKSLNDYLLPGPKLQDDLWLILTRWRFYHVVFVADIVKMFRQVMIDRRDADLQRIIWRESPDLTLQTYRLLTVTYGTTSAPYQAIRVLLELAEIYKEQYPRASKLIKENKYVDDFLAGADSAAEAGALQGELIDLLKEAGISLGKWAANQTSLLPKHQPTQSPALELKLEEIVSTLGILWLPLTDNFCFKIDEIKIPSKITKRTILSDIARLFDPLGWLGPIIIRAKILMQTLWISGSGWDESLPTDLESAWLKFISELRDLKDIRVPRWLGSFSISRLELHGFSDASERAYAAAVYLVAQDGDKMTSNLILAKTRVAPIKTLSMPRLELCGAHLLAKLMREFLNAMEGREFGVYCWTDARIVLSWLSDHPSRWTTFVATRTCDILTLLPAITWQHVKSQDNPADLATRGLTPLELNNCPLWWQGPHWLTNGPRPEPAITRVTLAETPEQRATTKFTFMAQRIPEEIIDRFSSFQRLLRVLCYCIRFTENARRQPKGEREFWISTVELQRCRVLLVKVTQLKWFHDEMVALQRNKPVHRSSPLRQLRPFLDNDGLIRVGGRLSNSSLSYNEKHPVILPKHSSFTRLLINHAHLLTLHGGPQLTQSHLLRSYWIVRGKSAIYSVIKECVRCARMSAKPQCQLMGALPTPRVTRLQPFQRAGVDYAGPLQLRVSPGRGVKSYKGYICIFVCMTVKAVHIEIVSDYTSAAFIAAFKRFVSRRGRCAELFSDNGTNFHGAKGELQWLHQQSMMRQEIAEYLENDGTRWRFIPPSSPHWGGLWEAAVKSAKHHLRRVIGDLTLTYEELSTLTTQVEACMNSRPLCVISQNSQDYTPLTPGHFLTGSAITVPPEPYSNESSNANLASRWLQITHMRNEFWRRWSTEYLHTLQQRTKWSEPAPNLQVGDIVLIMNEPLPPTKWALARVEECHPGKDGLTRVVTLRTATSTLTRPVTRICKLPIQEAQDQ